MKIKAIRMDAGFLAKAAKGLKDFSCKGKSDAVVVSCSGKVNEMLSHIIEKQLVKKEDITADLAEVVKYYTSVAKTLLTGKTLTAYTAEVKKTAEALHQTLAEGALFKMSDKSLDDYALANGSFLSAKLVYEYIAGAQLVDGRDIVVSDAEFGDAVINWEATAAKVKKAFAGKKGTVIVSGGFATTPDGYTTSLGCGGADLTATTLGAVLKCECVEFYGYADGICDADASIIPNAKSLKSVTYEEAAQLSYGDCGSSVYPPAIWPAVVENIPLVVKNILNPDFQGTHIDSIGDKKDKGAIRGIRNISSLDLITVYGNGLSGRIGTASRLFGLLSENEINIVFISQSSSEYSICFAVSSSDGRKAVKAIEDAQKNKKFLSVSNSVIVKKNISIVSVCGNRMRNVPGISGKVFSVLGDAGVNIIASAQGGEELNISFATDSKDVKKCVKTLYAAFLG